MLHLVTVGAVAFTEKSVSNRKYQFHKTENRHECVVLPDFAILKSTFQKGNYTAEGPQRSVVDVGIKKIAF